MYLDMSSCSHMKGFLSRSEDVGKRSDVDNNLSDFGFTVISSKYRRIDVWFWGELPKRPQKADCKSVAHQLTLSPLRSK